MAGRLCHSLRRKSGRVCVLVLLGVRHYGGAVAGIPLDLRRRFAGRAGATADCGRTKCFAGLSDFGNASVVPYKGDNYSVIASANYGLNKITELNCVYSFSRSDYEQNNFDGVPLGVNYTRHGILAGISRRLTPHLTSTLRYGFYRYLEPSSGGLNDYTAHGIFATLVVKWP